MIDTTIPATLTQPPNATATPIIASRDKTTITASVQKTLEGYNPSIKNTDFSHVDYHTVGWNTSEPLIREITVRPGGVVSVWFSAWHDGGKYIDVSDYNTAELAATEIAANLKALALDTPLTDISVAAWAPLPLPSACQMLRIDRMAFVRLLTPQFALLTYDQWSDLNGDEMFAAMK